MCQVDIHSEIPEQHPNKRKVEAVFRDVLGSENESWTVLILQIHGIFWTVFLIRDTDGYRKVLLLDDAREQRPEFIARSLRSVLREVHSATAV